MSTEPEKKTTELAVASDTYDVSFDDMNNMAMAVFDSGMFGVKNVAQALTLMMLAQSERIHPIKAMTQYHIIEGKPSMRADTMQAKFQQAGGIVHWIERSNEAVTAEFSHPRVHPNPLRVTWDDERVKIAGLMKNNHQKYPIQMKSARCISEGIRAVMPGILHGFYTPEEVVDMQPMRPSVRQQASEDVIEGDVVPDIASFVKAWDAVSEGFGVSVHNGRAAMQQMLKKRTGHTDIDKVGDDILTSMIDEYRAATPDQIAKLKSAKPKKAAEPASEPLTWGWVFDHAIAAAAERPEKTGADEATRGLMSWLGKRDADTLPVEEMASVLEAVRAGAFDFERGVIVTPVHSSSQPSQTPKPEEKKK